MKHFAFVLILLHTAQLMADQLKATIIGSGSPIYNEKRASASVLVSAGNTHLLVDMGNGTQANLNQMGFDIRNLSGLLFTHHHLDHNEEFVPILIRSLMGRNDFLVIGPPGTTKLTETNLELYEEDISYRLGKTKRTIEDRKNAVTVRDIQGGETFEIDGIRVSTLKVPHTIHSIAYRFDFNGESIVITGDLTFTEELPKLAKNADFLIIDSGGMVMKNGEHNRRGRDSSTTNRKARRKDTKPRLQGKKSRVKAHLNLLDSSLIAKKANVKNLIYTHFTTGEVDQEASLKIIRTNYAGNVIFGEDFTGCRNDSKQNLE